MKIQERSLMGNLQWPIVFTIALLTTGSLLYFLSVYSMPKGEGVMVPETVYDGMRIKVAYTPQGELKLFVFAKNNELAKLKAQEGYTLPESNSIIIGYQEATIMRAEGLFAAPNDRIDSFFGISPVVGGILAQTNSSLDFFHFVSEAQFAELQGEEGIAFVQVNNDGMEKLFSTYALEDNSSLLFPFDEGSLINYETHTIGGVEYYPLILGAKEAELMRSEQLFIEPGDIIKDFFGKNMIVAGVLEETNTTLDLMHISPLREDDY